MLLQMAGAAWVLLPATRRGAAGKRGELPSEEQRERAGKQSARGQAEEGAGTATPF